MQKKTEDGFLNKRKSNKRESDSNLLILFWEFFKIGVFTLGGGVAMIPQMQQMVTVDRKWLSEEETLDCIAIGQSLPGVIAVNLATYVGYRQRGTVGAIVATAGIIIPAFIAILLALALLSAFGENRFVQGAFMGVKAAVCGLVIVVSIKLLKQMLKGAKTAKAIFTIIMAAGSLLAVGIFGVTAILVIVIGIVVGIAFDSITRAKKDGRSGEAGESGETGTSGEVKK